MVNVIVKGMSKKVKRNKLKLIGMGITDISQIKGLENLTSLSALNLKNNFITEIKGLEHLTNLDKLNLSGNQITEIKGLEYLNNLKFLTLSNNNISEIKGLENLRDLWELDLRSNNISEIKGLENLTNVSTLSLDNNKFTDIKGLESLTSLIEITLGLLRYPKLGFITGYNLNGKIIPRNIAKKMGIKHIQGDAISRVRVYIRTKKMVKYCQFVKDTGNVDCNTPGIVEVYNQWKNYH